jgi:ribulose-5-phosphate 4-epimerase/fuculose-1-phosphate aldolase
VTATDPETTGYAAKLDAHLDGSTALGQAQNYARAFAALTEFDDIHSGTANANRAHDVATIAAQFALVALAESVDRAMTNGATVEALAEIVTGLMRQARRQRSEAALDELAGMLDYSAGKARELSLAIRLSRRHDPAGPDGEASTDG